jgi:uncharacterized protein YdaU (DUF1376 family)
MAKDPAFLFYPNDYLGGTMGMTFEEKGAYIELLMMQFNRGHMTSHMVGQTVGQLWVKIEDKFEVDNDGKYFNKRLEEEQIKRKAFTDSRKNNIKGNNQYTKNSKKTGHMTSHMEDENENVNKDKKEKENRVIEFPFTSKNFYETWEQWKEYKKAEHRFNYKSVITEQAALMTLVKLSDSTEQDCIQIIMHTIGNGWKGFVKQNTKNNNNGTDHAQQTANSVERLINKYRAEAEQEIGNA